MLITTEIKIKINNKNIEHFNNLKYSANYGDIIKVSTMLDQAQDSIITHYKRINEK